MKARYRVIFLGRARADLADAKRWLLQPGSGARSHRRYGDILRAIQDLKTSPDRWPFGDHDRVRERPVAGYRMVYQVHEQESVVRILRVFGPFQNQSDL